MRKITVGAIQPGDVPFPAHLDCLSDTYAADVDIIMNEHVLPQLDVTLSLLEQAGQVGCGIVTTSEDTVGLSRYLIDASPQNRFDELVVKATDIAEERFSELARRNSMYIVASYFKRIEGKNYNIASVFGRNGQIVGEYRKTHLPPNEMWQMAEGDDLNVIELDFGRIAVSICYDMMFPESVAVQAKRGAEIIFHPTGGYGWYDSIGEATLRTRANDNDVYIVTAKNYVLNHAGKSSVIDYWGQVLVDAGFYKDVIVYKEIDLDVEKAQHDWFYQSQMSGVPNMARRRAMERRPDLYGPLVEAQREKLTAPDEETKLLLMEKVRNGLCRW